MNIQQFETMAAKIIDEAIHQYPAEVAGTLGSQYTTGNAAVYTTGGVKGAQVIIRDTPDGGTESFRRGEIEQELSAKETKIAENCVKVYIDTLAAEFAPDTDEPYFYSTVEQLVNAVQTWAESHGASISWMRNTGDILYPGTGAVVWTEGAPPCAEHGWR